VLVLMDNNRDEEAGLVFRFGPHRDSARRGPLRQPGLSPLRGLGPRQARLIGGSHARFNFIVSHW